MILKRSLKVYVWKLLNYIAILATGRIILGDDVYKMNGIRKMRMPIDSSYRDYEGEVKVFFERELRQKKGHFIDVGVNFGQTLIALLCIDKNRPYIGIEPQPVCAFEVNLFIRNNDLKNHDVICACLGKSAELITLNFKNDGDVGASTISEFRPSDTLPNKLISYSISGDQLIRELKITDIAILKIDVEGAELEVLQSFSDTLKNISPTIIFEILPHRLVYNNQPLDKDTIKIRIDREESIKQYMKDMNYQTFLLLPNGDEVKCDVEACPEGRIRNFVARAAI